ncbi:MAG: nickel pincer cofactor biosynthesis protein LarB [Myxococcota bacterium]
MNARDLLNLLESVRDGKLPPLNALEQLKELPYKDLEDFARVDHFRALRRGDPEVIFGEGKTAAQVAAICQELNRKGQTALVTRLHPDKAVQLKDAIPDGEYYPVARIWLRLAQPWRDRGRGEVLVVCAGTSDLPVAEEAAITLHALGNRVGRITDVGVAGLHRVLAERPRLQQATCIVVVAGMEGALPSVVAGLVQAPVIAVPTSVGYGAAFGGVAALLAMLNSCATGVSVVNIDNGFGAAYCASLINRAPEPTNATTP